MKRVTGYESLTIDATAGGIPLTVAKYLDVTTSKVLADYAIATIETADIRFTIDGTSPTASVGHPLEAGRVMLLENYDELQKFRGFRSTSVSGNLKVTYFKTY